MKTKTTPSLWFLLRAKLRGRNAIYDFYFQGRKTLDIACGEGHLLRQDQRLMFGFDLNKGSIERLEGEGYQVKIGNVSAFPYSDNEFERAHCHNLIEHLATKEAFQLLVESGRILKPGGWLVLSSEVVTKKFWGTFEHIKPYPPGAVIKLLKEAGRGEFGGVSTLEPIGLFYLGGYQRNRLRYLLSLVAGFYTPLWRRQYYLILRKKKVFG
jgi:SAM-dependent methyltransferase